MMALVHVIVGKSSTAAVRPVVHETEPDPVPNLRRLTFAPDGIFTSSGTDERPEEPAHETVVTSSIAPATNGWISWATETKQESIVAEPTHRFTLTPPIRLPWQYAKPRAQKRFYTLKARLAELSPAANLRLATKFEAAKASWPPSEIALLAIKDERALELHARSTGGAWTLIHRYRVQGASGGSGPKLRQGDRQVPEGIYAISFLNPNSAYHVSLRVNYPNAFDRQMAQKDGRKELGGDIMIHGKNLSAGCLAMGDEAVEELFVLAAQTGLANIKLVIAPTDFRQNGMPSLKAGQPEWLPKLYADVASNMAEFKPPPSPSLLSFFTR